MSSDRVTAAVASLMAAVAELADLDCDQFTHLELVELLGELETVTWRLPTVGHRVIARLQREASPTELGAKSLGSVLTQRLRISGREVRRRLSDAEDLGPRMALNGQPLNPKLAPPPPHSKRARSDPSTWRRSARSWTSCPAGWTPRSGSSRRRPWWSSGPAPVRRR